MRLLVIHEQGQVQGGAEHYLLEACSFLKRVFEIRALFPHSPDPAFVQAVHGVEVIPFDTAEGFEALLEKWRPDRLYLHKCSSLPLMEKVVASGLPSARMVHDHEGYCMRTYKYFPLSRRVCKKKAGLCCLFPCLAFVGGGGRLSYRHQMALRELDRRLTVHFVGSQYMREELIRQGYSEGNIAVLPPVPRPLINPVQASFDESNTLLFVGQVVRGKGLDCLLQSLAFVTRSFRLLVFGEGSHLSHCRKLAERLGLSDRVEFRGFVSREEMADGFRQASLMVFPSVWPEPFGRVGLEAMEHGLPVVGFDSGGVRDWLREGVSGRLVPWMDVVAMGEAIEELLTNKDEARRLGESARRFAAETFSFEAAHDREITLLKSLGCDK